MSKVLVVDYGMGNLRSVCNAVKLIGHEPFIGSASEDIASADRIILPGVGAFGDAMNRIRYLKLDELLINAIHNENKKLLGICLGAQLICNESDEYGLHKGLGWIDARVESLRDHTDLIVPHVGWNDILIKRQTELFDNIQSLDFYFVHSYHLVCNDEKDVVATCDYGITFPVVVRSGNVTGVQFHPEKSQKSGLMLLKNFLEGSDA